MTMGKKARTSSSPTTHKQGAAHAQHGGSQKSGAAGGARMTPRGDERRRAESKESEAFDAPGVQRPPSDS
jgi:hypothetical protein